MRKDERAVAAQMAAEVRRLRKALGWSQLVLAERAGISLNYVNLIERAEQLPAIRVLLQLAKPLGTTLAGLVGGGEAGDAGEEADPWLVEATGILRALPPEARPVAIGVLRAVEEATTGARPEGSVARPKRRGGRPS